MADENDRNLDPRDGDFVICPTCGDTIDWSLGTTKTQKKNENK